MENVKVDVWVNRKKPVKVEGLLEKEDKCNAYVRIENVVYRFSRVAVSGEDVVFTGKVGKLVKYNALFHKREVA